jgi:hypothetical protein
MKKKMFAVQKEDASARENCRRNGTLALPVV